MKKLLVLMVTLSLFANVNMVNAAEPITRLEFDNTPIYISATEGMVSIGVPVAYYEEDSLLSDEEVLGDDDLRAYLFRNDGLNWNYYSEADHYVDGVYFLEFPAEGTHTMVLNLENGIEETNQKFIHFEGNDHGQLRIEVDDTPIEIELEGDATGYIQIVVPATYYLNDEILSDEQVLAYDNLRAYLFRNNGSEWSYYGEADDYINGAYRLNLPIDGIESYALNLRYGDDEEIQKYIHFKRSTQAKP